MTVIYEFKLIILFIIQLIIFVKMPTQFLNQETPTSFCDLMLILDKFEKELQTIRQIITLRSDFYPEPLFNHLSGGDSFITRQTIFSFLQENGCTPKEEEIRIYFSIYGYKDKISYRGFLNYIFPFNVETIKNISTTHARKYIKSESRVSEEVLALLVLLIQKEIEFINYFEEAKADLLPNLTRESLKKLMKQLKKYTHHNIQGLQSDNVLTKQQFFNIFKKEKHLPQKTLIPLCRRLSMQKYSFIGLDELQIWLKPWNKLKIDDLRNEENSKKTLFDDIEDCLLSA